MPTKKELQKELDKLSKQLNELEQSCWKKYSKQLDQQNTMYRDIFKKLINSGLKDKKNYERLKEKYEELGKREWMNGCIVTAVDKWIEEEHNAGNSASKDVCFSDFIPSLYDSEPDAFKYKEELLSDEEEEEA